MVLSIGGVGPVIILRISSPPTLIVSDVGPTIFEYIKH